jgi:hypothetical protein
MAEFDFVIRGGTPIKRYSDATIPLGLACLGASLLS